MAKPKKRRLEAVRWADHCCYSESGWKSVDDIKALTPSTIVTVGYIASETPKHLTLVSTLVDDGHSGRGEQCIIKSAIVKRWRLPDPTA